MLAELRALHGDLQFRVIGTAALTTQSGQRGEVGGTTLHVEQTALVQGETLNAEIEMLLQGLPTGGAFQHRLTVRTALRRGEFVVLGQSELARRRARRPRLLHRALAEPVLARRRSDPT